jgi:WD40 repeat protein
VLTLPELNSFDYSPDGSRLLATTAHEANDAWIVDAATGERLLALHGHAEPINGVQWSADGRLVATASDDGSARVWDPDEGRELLRLRAEPGASLTWAAISPDGSRLATAGAEPFVRVWDLGSGRQTAAFEVPGGGRGGIAPAIEWSPDGSRLAVAPHGGTSFGSRFPLKVWSVDSGRLLFTSEYVGDEYGGWDVEWSPDGARILTAGPTVKWWDARTGRRVSTLFPASEVYDLEFSPDGQLLAAGAGNGITEIWSITPQGPRRLLALPASGGGICCVAFSPDGTTVAAGIEGSIEGANLGKLWDVSPEGGGEWLTLPAVEGQGPDVDFSPDGHLLAISRDYTHVSLHDAVTGEKAISIDASGPSTGIDFSPDGSRIATSGAYGAAIWDAASGDQLLRLEGHEDWVNKVRFSPDGDRLVTGSDDGSFRLWDASTGEQLLVLEDHDGFDWGAAFSPDGRLLATAGDGRVKLWDAITGRQIRTLAETSFVMNVVFSPDGDRLAAGLGEGNARVWDPASGRELLELGGHVGSVTSVAFSPDGQRVATAGQDGLVKVWNATTGEELLSIRVPGAEISGVAFAPDGGFLAASVTDGTIGTVRVWVLGLEDLVEVARARVTRPLADEECRRFLHLERCPAV